MSYGFEDLLDIISVLRGDNGCPWDRKQDFDSMKKYIIEEAYETVQAIENKDKNELCEELGDLLFQVVFQAKMAEEKGLFDINDVINAISTKMVYRHPHVFADSEKPLEDRVSEDLNKWEDNKRTEKGYKTQTEVLRAIPVALPAIMRAEKVLYKAENAGLDMAQIDETFASHEALSRELMEGLNASDGNVEDKVGLIVLKMVNISRKMQLNTEFSLTKAIEKFINRFEYIESSAEERNLQLKAMSAKNKKGLWESSEISDADV
ncbi:nucleoside triphosphate pyrophosphohydrolase [Clostridiales bacterium]|nr:nucleoside triphosphate pyrophosphohydrolase [Clostridiales bacterium]